MLTQNTALGGEGGKFAETDNLSQGVINNPTPPFFTGRERKRENSNGWMGRGTGPVTVSEDSRKI